MRFLQSSLSGGLDLDGVQFEGGRQGLLYMDHWVKNFGKVGRKL